ncbi:hypothetical protein [Aureliella helgolandensis]|uniref:Uncharacterized protein n=1 Tax=Aureliella helgolandensis TaxID=2527968 RepID=A0A518G128_9BACT|nr:hypothetical protein [Aureliella helgolandensis]QDV22303.1 hypothetical protein Q31a_05870 [Aureliella helgolandensis]
MARYDDLNDGAIAYTAFVGSVVFLLIILLVRALCYGWIDGEDMRKLAGAHYVEADAEIASQKARISQYAKEQIELEDGQAPAAGQATERILIPMARAKELILKEYQSEQPTDGEA